MINWTINWFSYFKKIKYLAQTAVITGLLVAFGLTTMLFDISSARFQASDGLFLGLVCIIPGPMMFIAGMIYPMLLDIIAGVFHYIPASIAIHILMYVVCKVLSKFITPYGAIPISASFVLLYGLYWYFMNIGSDAASSTAIWKTIVNSIQLGVSAVIGVVVYVGLNTKSFKKFIERQIQHPDFFKNQNQNDFDYQILDEKENCLQKILHEKDQK
ncbi:hypothetical protein [Williamsoniiplasma luminosum]|nr:hypothetical protein [Williamsoniiplasma luminosum]